MSGLGIKLYTDEDVDPRPADLLFLQGYDTLSCRRAGNHNQHLPDEWQLEYATSEGRAILVYDLADYLALDRVWRTRGKEHFGIITSTPLPIGELVRRMKHHLDTYTPEYQYHLVLHLARQ